VTNDDGIFAPGLWALVAALKEIAEVVVVAPDREQSAVGTALTLRQPLRVQQVSPVPGVETYSVEGTPGDSVILALSKLLGSRVDMVVSGVNRGPNLGDDALISGTVAAALQGYLRGLPAIAISSAGLEDIQLEPAARLAALLVRRIQSGDLPDNVFLNVNLPGRPLDGIKDIKLSRLAHKTHIDTVREGHDGRREYYWLVRQKLSATANRDTDIWAIEQGFISVTPLHSLLFQMPPLPFPREMCARLLTELKEKPGTKIVG
jgi:5'-nucleotidase